MRKPKEEGPPSGTEEPVNVCNVYGVRILKEFEGLRLEAYKCPAGVWTIGYGHTRTAKEGMKITSDVAEALLLSDLSYFEKEIIKLLPRGLSNDEFSALVCFCYNVGMGAFKRSTMLRLLKEGKKKEAADEFMRWNKAGGKELPGLTRRRAAERDLFLKKQFYL